MRPQHRFTPTAAFPGATRGLPGGAYDTMYPAEDEAAWGVPPPPPYSPKDASCHNPYRAQVMGQVRSNAPYKANAAQHFPPAHSLHPVLDDQQAAFDALCTRHMYLAGDGYGDAAEGRTGRVVAAPPVCSPGAPMVRVVAKNVPLEYVHHRQALLSRVLSTVLGVAVPVDVEAPRPSRTNGLFFDAVVFMWVPAWAVPSMLQLQGRVLCDHEDFIVDESGWVDAGDRLVLERYGQLIRERMSQEQRHKALNGLPCRPLEFQVSTSQVRGVA